MTAPYKAYRVRVQLECGHTSTVRVEYPHRVPEEFQPCSSCGHRVAIWAIECREWRSKCQKVNCRYVRWAGQVQELANQIADKHYWSKHHMSAIRYTINPATFQIVKKFAKYAGRNFRFRIDVDDEKPKVPYPRRIQDMPDEPQF